MTLRIPDASEEAFLDLLLSVGYTLHLYSNNVAHNESLVASAFTEATFGGYASVALTGGAWVTTPGDPTSGAYAQQSFTSSADQTPETLYGYYVTLTADGTLRWYEAFGSPVTVQYNLDRIDVIPQFTLADTGD
jgi:hypothetical protein